MIRAAMIVAVVLMGCESPVQPQQERERDLIGTVSGTEPAGCVKYRLWPHKTDPSTEHGVCGDGMPSEIMAAQWESVTPGMCRITPDGSGIRGGLQAVRYVWGCPHNRQGPTGPVDQIPEGE